MSDECRAAWGFMSVIGIAANLSLLPGWTRDTNSSMPDFKRDEEAAANIGRGFIGR